MTSSRNTVTYAGRTWNLGGEVGLTRAQKNFLDELCGNFYNMVADSPTLREKLHVSAAGVVHTGFRWTTTQFRRLAPFIALNSRLIEELPRTARGGWGYRLRRSAALSSNSACAWGHE